MPSPADDAADILAAAGIGTIGAGTGWSIRVGTITNLPDTQIAIHDTGGSNPHPTLLINEPHIQVMIRSATGDYTEARQKAKDVQDVLLGMNPITMASGDRWDGVTGIGDINGLGRDDKDRITFTVNFRIILEQADSMLSNRDPL
jgi:hypothetical protein